MNDACSCGGLLRELPRTHCEWPSNHVDALVAAQSRLTAAREAANAWRAWRNDCMVPGELAEALDALAAVVPPAETEGETVPLDPTALDPSMTPEQHQARYLELLREREAKGEPSA